MSNKELTVEPKAWAGNVPVYCSHDKLVPPADLRPNPKNPNTHNKRQLQALAKVIETNGWRDRITVSNRSGMIVKGHGRWEAAKIMKCELVPVDYQDYESAAAEYADMVADNRLAELSEMDQEALGAIFREIDLEGYTPESTGYTSAEFQNIAGVLAAAIEQEEKDLDAVPEEKEPAEIVTKPGDIWILGRHRVMCGDCTDLRARAELFDGATPQILMSDPPYCSGGFQEAGRRIGSIGSKQMNAETGKANITPKIANDTLSTRGYQALIKNMLTGLPCVVSYLFTDWRMWVYLYDLVESSGFGVKSMLVWDKGSPGMGQGWRPQHELVVFGLRATPKWDMHKGYGNVLKSKRTGNKLHPTQKPVDLLAQLLDNTEWAEGVYDPFGGSGTTLVACEKKGQTCYAMELEPAFVDVIVQRYVVTTGRTQDVQLIRDGKKAPPGSIRPGIR